jgi:hypothetical protein
MQASTAEYTITLFAYADTYADLLWEKITICWLKSSSSEQGE